MKESHTFSGNEKVTWKELEELLEDMRMQEILGYLRIKMNQEAWLREIIKLYGKGPFTILEMENVSSACRAQVGHHQRLTIQTEKGTIPKVSGLFLKVVS